MKRLLIVIIMFITCYSLHGQNILSGYVIDEQTEEPIPYVYVIKPKTSGGTITNEDGYFELDCSDTDSLEFSYLGYEKIVFSSDRIKTNNAVKLKESTEILSQVTVIANQDYLYDIVHQVRKNLAKEKQVSSSKAYLFTTTTEESKPIEVSEYFFNLNVVKGSIQSLQYKNGQSYLAERKDGGIFLNRNISKAISMYSLIEGNTYFPVNPLELSKKKLRKNYELELANKGTDFIKINFTPIQNKKEYFHGSIWVNPNNFELRKIEINSVGNGRNLFRGILQTEIKKLDFSLTYAYQNKSTRNNLQFVAIRYDAVLKDVIRDKIFTVNTESILHSYDFINKFEMPKIDYPVNISDYRILEVPRDSVIWNKLHQQNQVKLSNNQHRNLILITNEGINFNDIRHGENEGKTFESNYEHWSSEKRVRINLSKKKGKAKTSTTISDIIAEAKVANTLTESLYIETILYSRYT